jgi:hypothetical protein
MENMPKKLKIRPKIWKIWKMCTTFFENFGKHFQNIDMLGFYSNVKGLIMETSVRITMEADVTMDLRRKATMKTKSVSIGLRSTVQC